MNTKSIATLGIILLFVVSIGAGSVLLIGGNPNSTGNKTTTSTTTVETTERKTTVNTNTIKRTPTKTTGVKTSTTNTIVDPRVTTTAFTFTMTPKINTDTPTPTPTPTPLPTPQKTITRSPTPTETFDKEKVNETKVEKYIENQFLEYRDDKNVDGNILLNGNTYSKVKNMVRNHSSAMADNGVASFEPTSRSVYKWYEKFNIYSSCTFKHEAHIETPNDGNLMLVGKITATDENETNIGKEIFTEMKNTSLFFERKSSYKNASTLAVGVTVKENGNVFATYSIC